MATSTTTMPTLSDEQVAELLHLAGESDSVELKLTVPELHHRSTAQALGLDPLQGQIRQVVFFDTPKLALDKQGLVVRARRIQGKGDDSVVKLRPVVPHELPGPLRSSPGFRVEVDAMPGGFVCSGALTRTLDGFWSVSPRCRAMSRSVTTPATRPCPLPSVIGTSPTSSSRMIRRASEADWSAETTFGSRVITSLAFMGSSFEKEGTVHESFRDGGLGAFFCRYFLNNASNAAREVSGVSVAREPVRSNDRAGVNRGHSLRSFLLGTLAGISFQREHSHRADVSKLAHCAHAWRSAPHFAHFVSGVSVERSRSFSPQALHWKTRALFGSAPRPRGPSGRSGRGPDGRRGPESLRAASM